MILLPDDLRARLTANGAAEIETDHVPVLKLFNPLGAATWICSELDADGDTLFGLADLGFGCPELGSFSLSEIASIRLPLGLGIERDLYFRGLFPLSVYVQVARTAGRIVEAEDILRAAAQSDPELPPAGCPGDG